MVYILHLIKMASQKTQQLLSSVKCNSFKAQRTRVHLDFWSSMWSCSHYSETKVEDFISYMATGMPWNCS